MFSNIERGELLHAALRIRHFHSVAEWARASNVSVSAAQKTASGIDVGPNMNKIVDTFIMDVLPATGDYVRRKSDVAA